MYDPKEVLEICENATPGPWEVNTDHRFIDIIDPKNPKFRIATAVKENDADFIALARTVLPELAKEVIKLRAVAEAAQKLVEAEKITNDIPMDVLQQALANAGYGGDGQ